MKLFRRAALALVAGYTAMNGQTVLNIGSQGRLKAGTVLPATCLDGQVFLRANGGGDTLYACSSGAWVPVGGAAWNLAQNGDGSLSANSGLNQRLCVVSSSATPVFDAAQCNMFALVLGPSAESDGVLVGARAGQELTFVITQDGTGGRTFVWPSSFPGPCTVSETAGVSTVVTAIFDGSDAIITGCTTTDDGTLISGPTRQAPAAPTAGLACWFDAAGNTWKCLDPNGNTYAAVRTSGAPAANQFMTYVDGNGLPHTAAVSAAQLSEGTTGTGAVVRSGSPTVSSPTFTGQTVTQGISLGADCVSRTWTVGAASVAAHTLVFISSGTVIPATTSGGPVYGISKTDGAPGAAIEVCIAGGTQLRMDNTAAADHIAIASTTTGGNGVDSGQTALLQIAATAGLVGKIVAGCAGTGCLATVNLDGSGRNGGKVQPDVADLTANGKLAGNLNIGRNALIQEFANDTVSGTVNQYLVVLKGTNQQVQKAGTANAGVLGLCQNVNGNTCGTSGNASVIIRGSGICTFDNAATEGDYFQANGTDGRCHDVGGTYPTGGGSVVGRVLETGASGPRAVNIGAEPPAMTATVTGGGTTVFTPPYVSDGTNFYYGSLAVTRPQATGWVWANQGTSSVNVVNGSLQFAWQTNSGTDNLRCYMRSLPASSNYTVTVGLLGVAQAAALAIGDGTKYEVAYLVMSGTTPLAYQNWNSTTSYSGNVSGTIYQPTAYGTGVVWLKVQDTGANRILSFSADGQNWTMVNSAASHSFLTETQFGVCQETNQPGSPVTALTLLSLTVTTP
jgi:hypothetical protein